MPQIEFTLSIDQETGKSILFKDTTPNADYALIKGVRFQFGNYLAQQEPITSSSVLEQFRKYLKVEGTPQVYGTISVSVGDIFIPLNDTNVIFGDAFEDMGYYVPPTSFLPTATNTLVLNSEDWGLDEDIIFPNTTYQCQYETYIDTTPSTLTNVTIDTQYMVVGNGTAIYNGNTYQQYQVFTAVDNGVVSFTGSANLKKLDNSRQKFYVFVWELTNRFYLQAINNIDCNGNQFLLNELNVELRSLEWLNLTQRVNIKYAQTTINYISNKLTQLENS
jgi:hypothetical protein